MSLIVADRVQETTNSTGTGAYTLGGAVAGFQAFSAVTSDTDTVYYAITDNVGFEVGLGTYSSGTITRTTVFSSSNSGAAVDWGTGTKNIFLTYPAGKAVVEDVSNNVTIGNNIILGGTVDGRDVAADGTALDGAVADVLVAGGTGYSTSYVSTVAVGGTTFAQPAVEGRIHSDQGEYVIDYAGATGITVASGAASVYVYIDSASNLQQQTTTPTRQDWSRKLFTMRIAVDTVAGTILGFEYLANPLGHYPNSIRDIYSFMLAQGVPFKKDQTVTGRSDLGFDVSAGTLMEFGGTGDIHNANILSFNAVANAGFFLSTRTAFDAGGNTNLPKFWDDGGTLTALGSTTLVGHRLYRFSNGNLCLQYGQGNYANMTLAKAGVLQEDYVLNPALKNATFFGWWLIQSTATVTTGTPTLTAFVEYTLGVQGGVSSALSGAALIGNNGSDFLDAGAVRTNIGLGTAATTAATDYVQVTATTGQANLPAGTTAQRTATPGTGALRFNSTDVSFEGYNGTEWGSIGGGAADGIFYENEQNVTADYTIVATKNAMTAGPITIASGVSVTIETGGRWIVL
jgi:hypothetical protein